MQLDRGGDCLPLFISRDPLSFCQDAVLSLKCINVTILIGILLDVVCH